jgi:TetR/AcrR family transcriptional repressor of nem operon
MRYSTQHKAETHDKLVKKAAEQFQRRGVQGTGIASLMAQLGLTHGGFYAHFENKNKLVGAAASKMFEEGSKRMIAAAEAAPEGMKVKAIVSFYLSPGHRDAAHGCPLPALAGEMARQPESVRKAYLRGMSEYLDWIARFLPGASADEKRDNARLLLSGMAGSMMIAKTMTDRNASDKFLEQARKFYIAAFEKLPARKTKG